MNNTKQASDKYKEAKDNYIRAFWADLKGVFDEYPKLEDFRFGVNNHEWNDGDSTSFSISWDYGVDCTYDGEEYSEVYPDDPNDKDPMNKSLMMICGIFEQSKPIHEDMFGDEYERVCISRGMVDMKIAELDGMKSSEKIRIKKYHVFAGDTFYPAGLLDYKRSFETIEEAIRHGEFVKASWTEIAETQEDGSLKMVYQVE